MTERVIVGLITCTVLATLGVSWAASPHLPPRTGSGSALVLPGAPLGRYDAIAPHHGPSSQIDLYGNQTEEALSDYLVDPAGDMYDRRSPETAISTLPSPTT